MGRKAISKKTRFEVFKRDSFTCQYCGKAAPSVVLHIDHIEPIALGGGNDLINLVTSCQECNAGKGARKLSDSSVLTKQIDQMKEINERREQLEMLASWRQGLKDLSDVGLGAFEKFLEENYGISLSDYGRNSLRKDIKKYGLDDVLKATEKSADQYLNDVDNKEDRAKFLDYIPRICYWQKRERDNPVEAELRKMAYTATRLWWKCDPVRLSHRLIELHDQEDVPKETLFKMISASTGIMKFEDHVQQYFNEGENGQEIH